MLLVHRQTTCIHKPTRLTTSHTWGEATTFPLIIFFVPSHMAYTRMSFCLKTPKLGVSKFPKLGFLWLCKPITFWEKLLLRWVIKQSYNLRQEFANCMLHTSKAGQFQIFNAQESNWPFFRHNLCFKYSNEMCEPILNIKVPRDFQWYNELFDQMNFDP